MGNTAPTVQKGVEIMKRQFGTTIGTALLSLALLTSLTGCLQTAQTPHPSSPGNQGDGSVTTNSIPPEENRFFSIPVISWDSSPDGKGFYRPGEHILEYYSIETKTQFPLCSQSGCSHSGESCQAWLGDVIQGFVTYGDRWFVLSVEEGTHAVLWQIDPQTHQRTKLCDIAPQNDQDNYYFSSGFVSHGYAYLNLYHQLFWDELVVEQPSLIRVNLANRTVETLVEDVPVTFLGAGEDRVLLAVETFAVPPLSEEEYRKQHPNGNYYVYLENQLSENGSGGVELREYTPEMDSYQVLTKGNVWVSTTQDLCRYGDYTLYAVDDTLYVYDLSTGESRTVSEEGDLINFCFTAGQILYLVQTPDFFVRYTDVEGGPTYTLENEGSQEIIVFAPSGECQDYLYGLYSGKLGEKEGFLTKEDFFAERYENLIPVS